jgi:tetratricopeptide (TPR) repeat protein
MQICHSVIARSRKLAATLLAPLILLTVSNVLLAAPYIPTSDATPLTQLSTKLAPSAQAQTRITPSNRAMRALLARDPKNVDLAVRIAQLYVSRSRSQSDPRLLGQAQAALGVWWAQAEPPVPVLLLRATIRQTNHDFTQARHDLEQAVTREPRNSQAWLTLATVQQVTGNLKSAAESCGHLVPIAPGLISTTCIANVNGAQGQASQSFDLLTRALAESAADRSTTPGVKTWVLTLQAELAERLSRMADAERLYRASLALDPSDAYTVAAFSDFLIDAGRAGEVLPLIPATTPTDILLLRRAIAAKAIAAPDSAMLADLLGQRFAASRARGDRVHLREEARFALTIKNAPDEALDLARANWAVQKEPLDARIALEAALAAKRPDAAREIVAWVDSTKLEGSKLAQLTTLARTP